MGSVRYFEPVVKAVVRVNLVWGRVRWHIQTHSALVRCASKKVAKARCNVTSLYKGLARAKQYTANRVPPLTWMVDTRLPPVSLRPNSPLTRVARHAVFYLHKLDAHWVFLLFEKEQGSVKQETLGKVERCRLVRGC